MANSQTLVASSVGGRERVRAIRAWWRTVHPPAGWGKRLEPAYFIGITLAVGIPFVYGAASSALADVATPRVVADWGPSLALVALLALVRWGAVQGPVVFSVPDVAQLLGAPLRRADLVVGRLVRSLAIGAAGAGAVAGLALIGIAGHHRGIEAARGVGFVALVMVLGKLGVAGASLVQGSARIDRITRRASWPIFLAAIGLVFLSSSSDSARRAVTWSGPWGWVVQPIVGGSGRWPIAAAAMVLVAVVVAALAWRRRGQCSAERHMARAQARGGAVAALYSMNSRFVGRSLASVGQGPARVPRLRLGAPRNPRLAIAWRDAVAAFGTPQRLGESVVLCAGGTLVCVLNAGHPAAVAGGALALYLGATRMLEPLRSETDTPDRVRVLLRAPMGQILAEHAIVPAVIALLCGVLACIGVAVAGALPRHGGGVIALALLATPAIVLCAGLSSRRGGQLSNSVMAFASTDTSGLSGLLVIGWIAAFPLLGVLLGTIPLSIVAHSGTRALPTGVVVLAAASASLTAGLKWQRFAPD